MHSASPRIAARRNSFRPAAILRSRAAFPRSISLVGDSGFTSPEIGRSMANPPINPRAETSAPRSVHVNERYPRANETRQPTRNHVESRHGRNRVGRVASYGAMTAERTFQMGVTTGSSHLIAGHRNKGRKIRIADY